ncbi:MAG: FMN-binding protein [Candidatus Omnitrophota bacterium]
MAKIITSLAIVGMLSGISLVFVYSYAMPKIQQNVASETEKAVKNIFPALALIDEEKEEGLFTIKDKAGKISGYAFLAEGGGYQGTIKLLAGIDRECTVLKGIEIIESQETPGLGAEIVSGKFRNQFLGLSITRPIEYVKNEKPSKPYQIEAITGATISSRAVVNILNKRIQEIRQIVKEKI